MPVTLRKSVSSMIPLLDLFASIVGHSRPLLDRAQHTMIIPSRYQIQSTLGD
jgi:hypothetical protein